MVQVSVDGEIAGEFVAQRQKDREENMGIATLLIESIVQGRPESIVCVEEYFKI